MIVCNGGVIKMFGSLKFVYLTICSVYHIFAKRYDSYPSKWKKCNDIFYREYDIVL